MLVAGGVLMLLSGVAKIHWPGPVPVVLAALGGLPLVGLSFVVLLRSGLWAAPILGITLAIGVLVDAVRRAPAAETRWNTIPSIAAAAAVGTGAYGVLGLLAPHTVPVAPASWLAAIHRPLSLAMLGAPALLILGWVLPHIRAATQIAAAIPLGILAVGLAFTGRWPGVVVYGVPAVFLAAQPLLQRMMDRRVAERHAEPPASARFEVATEAAVWGFVVMMALVGIVAQAPEERLALAVLTLITSAFTVSWYHLRSLRVSRMQQTVIGVAVYSFLGAVLVQVTGGMRSPYFFVYTLPIIAIAWTRAPKAIIVPLAIPLAALLLETVLGLRAGASPIGAMLAAALPRAAGLLLISGFSYLLARRALDEQTRVREAHLRLQTVMDHMAEGLVAVDAQGRVTMSNPAVRTLLGLGGDLTGHSLSDVLSLRRMDGSRMGWSDHPVGRALAGHRVPAERVIAAGPEGPIPLAVAATPLAGMHGPQGAIVLLRDARAEVEMERMRDDFFFIASHELRTPLTIMKGNLEMALEGASDGPTKTAVQEALASVARLARMVNDFLDAARLEHGAVAMRIEEGFLPDLVRQALATIRPDAERKGLALVYRETPAPPAVRMDVERTLQILLNLLGNSVRYATEGRIEVWHESDGGVVETLVRDAGPGIAPEHHERLFTRFGQVERGLTRGSGGSGLGLYISRKLAEQMGGTVVLKQSAPGQGSTFALRLAAAGSPRPDGRT